MALPESNALIVLDVMLSGIDGWKALFGVRRAGKRVPVLFLTARADVDDRVKGLDSAPMITSSNPFPEAAATSQRSS